MRIFPELTYIPTEFANSSLSNMVIYSKEGVIENPRIKDPFFILWLPLNLSEELLTESIQQTLPDFPIEKALTCTINLAYPKHIIQQEFVEDVQFDSTLMLLGKTIAKIIPLKKIINLLAYLALTTVESYLELECSSSMYYWSLITKLSIQLIAKGSFIPQVTRIESNNHEMDYIQDIVGKVKSIWIPVLKSEKDINNYARIQEYAPITAYNIPALDSVKEVEKFSFPTQLNYILKNKGEVYSTQHLQSLSALSRDYIGKTIDILVRKTTKITKDSEPSRRKWEIRVLDSLLSNNNQFDIFTVKEEIIPGIFERWSQKLNLAWDLGYSLKLILNSPDLDQEKDVWTMDFSLHSLSEDSVEYSLKEFWKITEKHDRRTNHLKDDSLRNYILKSLNILSGIYEPITDLLKQKNPHSLRIPSKDVITLLRTGMKEIRSFGFSIKMPDSYSLGGSQRIQPVLIINSKISTETSPLQHTTFDISSILTYEWVLKIGDITLSEEQTSQLLKSAERESLIQWNERWVLVDKGEIAQFQHSQSLSGEMRGEEALKLALTQNAYYKSKGSHYTGPYTVQFFGPLEEVIKLMKGDTEMPHEPQPAQFVGKLRKYQEYGFNWMKVLTSIGFGCVLADDMGLGKTIQIIALILSILQQKREHKNFLVVCPTSVLGNWMRELRKFAPSIKAVLHYGPNRAKGITDFNELLQQSDVILTSYNIMRRDIELLELVNFESTILDESQNIKNYKTKQAKAVYKLVERSRMKIALSGTPIENRITELWSLYHFLNPFLLGSRSQFIEKYKIPVGRLGNEALTTELRNLVNPFLLRRMKTNKNIIPELPDKQETEVFITLTEEQKKHYTTIVEEMLAKVEALEENSKQKFKQKGLILKAIMQLKQICNHPDQFLHTSLDEICGMEIEDFIGKSGKLQRLIELLEEAIASRSKILLFTQFKVMGDFLQYVIEKFFNVRIPFIHGGVSQEKRTIIVDQFQEDAAYETPILMLSLKAGGVGLNLSAASIVIHYDRWWNPAVEDQATDRAYRIGQVNKVNVYKMVASGTIEERISKMLQEKRILAEKIIKVTGEEWITELSFGELQDIFQLEE